MLTNGIDAGAAFTGTAGNDIYSGAINAQGAVTFQSFDALNGGAGSDTLIAQNVGGLVTTSTTLQSIENLEFVNHTAATVIDLSATTGVEKITLSSPAAGAHTVQGIAAGIKSVNVTGMTTNGDAATFSFQNGAVSGATDEVTLQLVSNGVAAGANVTVNLNPGTGANGFETLTIESTGGNNGTAATGTVTINDGNSTTLSTVKVTGTAAANLVLTPDTVKTIDASGNGAGVAVTVAATANQAQTITGGAGDDSFNLGATFDKNDTVAGGTGNDTLQFDINNAAFVLTDTFNVTGVETLRLSTTALNGTLDVSKFGADVKTVRLDVALGADRTISKLANDSTIELRDAAAQTLTASLASVTGTDDKLTINLRSDHVATPGQDTDTFGGFTAAGVESITIDSGYSQLTGADNVGDLNAITTLTAAAMKTLTVKGTTGLQLGTLGSAVTLVDSTALAPTLSDTTVGNGGLTVTLGTLANVAATVKTGTGNDNITGGAGDETITTGNGVDQVDIGTNGGIDNVNLGAGNDFLLVTAANLGATSTTYDTAAGGDGTDIIRVGATGTLVDSMFTNFTGFERIDAGTGSYAVNVNLGSAAATAFNNAIRIDQGAGAAQAWNVNASSLASGQTLEFRGADATATVADVIVGGSGADKIGGGVNANAAGDTLTGGAGSDIFFFRTRAEAIGDGLTTAATNTLEMDRITDFSAGVDKIQLGVGTAAFGTGVTFTSATTATVTAATGAAGDLADIAALVTAAATAFTEAASTSTNANIYIFTAGAGANAAINGHTYLILEDNSGTITAADTFIDITGVVGTLSAADFVFGNLFA